MFGLGALNLLKEGSLLVFTPCVFIVGLVARGYFFTLQVPCFSSGDILAAGPDSLNQFSELIFMFSMPGSYPLGAEAVVALGMLVWGAHLCFACRVSTHLLDSPCTDCQLLLRRSYMYFNERRRRVEVECRV